jgi:hypothetical protein
MNSLRGSAWLRLSPALGFILGLTIIGLTPLPGRTQSSRSPSNAQSPSSQPPVQVPAERVSIGSVIPGILDARDSTIDRRYVTAYRFQGVTGDPLQIRATGSRDTRTSNNLSLIPYLIIYGPDGRILTRTGVAPGTVDAFVRLRLPASGDYTAVIAGVQQGKPGRYWFAVQRLPQDSARNLTGIEISQSPDSPQWATPQAPSLNQQGLGSTRP